jgi:glycosyltransferase involved in cell wall biosynthesis
MADHHSGESDAATNKEIARLEHLVRTLSVSASLQAERADAEAGQVHAWRLEAALLRSSLFWRATAPARFAIDVARGRAPFGLPLREGLARARAIAAEEGWAAAAGRARAWLRPRYPKVSALLAESAPLASQPGNVAETPFSRPLTEAPGRIFERNVLIIAELTLPQCAKYRVWQKQEHFARLGVSCHVVNWHDMTACRAAVPLATAVIFYRVPGFRPVLDLIDECKRLGLPLWWEVDDLIFDKATYLQNRNLADLDPDLRRSILSGVPLYRAAMLACGRGIASTERLAVAMRDAGLAEVAVVENALDEQTLALASGLRGTPRQTHGLVITYGSGTLTHDADFAVAAAGLLAVLRKRPAVRLRIAGDLRLPRAFDNLGGRIERIPKTHYAAYLEQLAGADISIAPLEETIFNDAKSNIKFLEASVLGVASVCSPRATFRQVIEHGANGMLADSDEAWEASLLALVDDSALRRRIGEAALDTALTLYASAGLAIRQVMPLANQLAKRPPAALRVLMANVYFWPRSFGGATIVAEEMARRLHGNEGTLVTVVTGSEEAGAAAKDSDRIVRRYEMPVPGKPPVAVIALGLPKPNAILAFDNPAMEQYFGDVLDAVRPDVVHLHSVQDLSAAIARACLQRKIPYVITLHDAWWLCARQFMVQANGRYCFQKTIDLKVCDACVPGSESFLRQRYDLLLETLRGAALLLSPSEAHRQLYLAQGLPADKIVVAPNGVRHPGEAPAPRPLTQGRLTFAYVGGKVDVKGLPQVKAAFEALRRPDWRLVLVDNTLNLGFSSIDAAAWKTQGAVEIVPAYGQETMDAFFAGIDVLVFPSQWKESFGLTVREALLRGVWVITTAGGGAAEAVQDGVNGTIIPLDGKSESLLEALTALLDDPSRLAGMVPPATIIDFAGQAEQLRALLAMAARP